MLKQLILVCSVSAVWCSWLGASERMDHIHQTTLQNGLDVIVNDVRAISGVPGRGRLLKVSIPIHTDTNRIDLDLVARARKKKASIAGVEVWPLEREGFEELAQSWLEERGGDDPYALTQRAEAHLAFDRKLEALQVLETAEAIASFSSSAAERLWHLRNSLLPRIHSYAGADDFVEHLGEQAFDLAQEARGAAQTEKQEAIALYLEGRVSQIGGRLDDATIAFEELVFSGLNDTEPYLRMAECLQRAALAPEAERPGTAACGSRSSRRRWRWRS